MNKITKHLHYPVNYMEEISSTCNSAQLGYFLRRLIRSISKRKYTQSSLGNMVSNYYTTQNNNIYHAFSHEMNGNTYYHIYVNDGAIFNFTIDRLGKYKWVSINNQNLVQEAIEEILQDIGYECIVIDEVDILPEITKDTEQYFEAAVEVYEVLCAEGYDSKVVFDFVIEELLNNLNKH